MLLVSNVNTHTTNPIWRTARRHVTSCRVCCNCALCTIIMADFVVDADIIFLPCGFILLYSIFFYSPPNLSGRRLHIYCTSTQSWCGLSANLECRSEVCCPLLAGNTGHKNDAKNRHLRTTAHLCRGISSQLRHISTIGKYLLSSNIFSTCSYNMVNFGPLAAEIGIPANFNGFRVLATLLTAKRHSSSGVSQTLRR